MHPLKSRTCESLASETHSTGASASQVSCYLPTDADSNPRLDNLLWNEDTLFLPIKNEVRDATTFREAALELFG